MTEANIDDVLKLRPMEEKDIEEMVEIRNECREFLFDDSIVDVDSTWDFWQQKVLTGKETIMMVELFDVCIGYVNAKKESDCEIGIKLKKQYRNMGLGSKIIKLFSDYLKKQGIKSIWAYVKAENFASKKVFLRNGFKEQTICLKKTF